MIFEMEVTLFLLLSTYSATKVAAVFFSDLMHFMLKDFFDKSRQRLNFLSLFCAATSIALENKCTKNRNHHDKCLRK